ncbi:MAG: YhbY family RNA-binding protein [Gallionella sp.]
MLAHPLFAGFRRLHRLESEPNFLKVIMLTLSVSERLALKGRAHSLNPIVMIGNAGLTESVLKEIDASLLRHELIKIRVMGDDRALRESMMTEICTQLHAGPVQHIGKILVIFRPSPEANLIEIKKMPRHKGKKPLTKKQLGSRS